MPHANSPLVTVYITNHNYGRYIERAIDSVLAQTLGDFELIIIDDGSSDDSRSIIERFAENPRVIPIFQENKGLNVSNNIALRSARGKYVMRLDADDYLDENALSILSATLEREPDVGLVFPDYYLIDEHANVIEHVRRHNSDEVTLLDRPAHGACTMIRRECFQQLGGYDESFTCHDGFDLWIRMIQRYRVKNVNLPLFYYRRHPRSLTQDEERILTTRARMLEKRTQQNGRRLSALAVVPVRGTHLDPQPLALRPLGPQKLIDWTLHAALAADRISNVIVTTPDPEVLTYLSENYPDRVIPLLREPKLALPNTHIEQTLFHAIAEYTKTHDPPDALVVLYVESPFRTARHIDSALDVLEFFQTDSVVGVRPETDVFYRHNGAGLEPLTAPTQLRLERDDLYRQVGQLQAVRRDFLESHKQVVGGRVGHVVLDQTAAWRLRSDWDWVVAEKLAQSRESNPTTKPRTESNSELS